MPPQRSSSLLKKPWFWITILIVAAVSGFLTFRSSSPSGAIAGPLATSQNDNALQCPTLSSLKLEGFDKQANTWILDRAEYNTPSEKVVYIDPPSDKENGTKIFFCDLGKNQDQNSNYVYCGDFIRPIVLYKTDANGNTISNNKTSVEIVFDGKTKQYVGTKCGTYDLANVQ